MKKSNKQYLDWLIQEKESCARLGPTEKSSDDEGVNDLIDFVNHLDSRVEDLLDSLAEEYGRRLDKGEAIPRSDIIAFLLMSSDEHGRSLPGSLLRHIAKLLASENAPGARELNAYIESERSLRIVEDILRAKSCGQSLNQDFFEIVAFHHKIGSTKALDIWSDIGKEMFAAQDGRTCSEEDRAWLRSYIDTAIPET